MLVIWGLIFFSYRMTKTIQNNTSKGRNCPNTRDNSHKNVVLSNTVEKIIKYNQNASKRRNYSAADLQNALAG